MGGSVTKLFSVFTDDLDISPDFFEYFLATYPLLHADPSLWCVSAWNDNGKAELVSDEAGLYLLGRFSCLTVYEVVTGHLSEGLFVRNRVVHIPKFDPRPNSSPSPNFNPNSSPNPNVNSNSSPNSNASPNHNSSLSPNSNPSPDSSPNSNSSPSPNSNPNLCLYVSYR